MKKQRIVFVSTNWESPWGGSEVLWSEAARRLVADGHHVAASVYGWPTPARQLSSLREAGVTIHERKFTAPRLGPAFFQKALGHWIRSGSVRGLARWFDRLKPDLICITLGSPADDIDLMQYCACQGIPYTLLVQANAENVWPDDSRARLLIDIFSNARRNFFVARRNCMLLETQLGIQIPHTNYVWNPFNLSEAKALDWPASSEPLRLACVARLDPRAKGQDLLLRVLATEPWLSRPLTVSFYGQGYMEQGLRRLAGHLGLGDRARFCGQVEDIEAIWKSHHALVLPSRYEGLPLVVIEAMLCGRPAIVTDVGGNCDLITDGVTGFVAEAPTERHLQLALDRAWQRRLDWENMGKVAATTIRKLIPADPAREFGRTLLGVI